jgi:NAD(P)H-hydrate repair Nnr-like enzyme with NAD(P)H-hydrate dehydratase domain
MATAGMGDVLTGVIAGLLGQGLGAFPAACLGAAWHAASADVCVVHTGEASLMASDVMGALGETLLRVLKTQAEWSDGV